VEQIERELGVQLKKKEKNNSALESPRMQPKQSWIKRLFSTKTA
jgi:hypothetical protein